jgi:hypothetical protein
MFSGLLLRRLADLREQRISVIFTECFDLMGSIPASSFDGPGVSRPASNEAMSTSTLL